MLTPPPGLQKLVGDFCCIDFGGFSQGFSWRILLGTHFSHKKRREKSNGKIRKESGDSEQKNPQNKQVETSVLLEIEIAAILGGVISNGSVSALSKSQRFRDTEAGYGMAMPSI